jgi:hypothetical protein
METNEKLKYIVLLEGKPKQVFDSLFSAQSYCAEVEKYYDYSEIDEIVIKKNLNFTNDDKYRLSELMWQGGRNNFFETFCDEMDIEVDSNSEIFCDIEEYILEKIREVKR